MSKQIIKLSIHEKKALVKGLLARFRRLTILVDHDYPNELSSPFFDEFYSSTTDLCDGLDGLCARHKDFK